MAENLSFPFKSAPEKGQLQKVADGVFWLRMPLPFGIDHINLWLLEDGEGWTIVDSGVRNDETKTIWREIFAKYLDGRPVTRVLLTHFHPDHLGLAGWLVDEWQAQLWMTPLEFMFAQMSHIDEEGHLYSGMAAHYLRYGLPQSTVNMMGKMSSFYKEMISPLPPMFHRVRAGDPVMINGRRWEVMIGLGHSPEHACYYCAELNVIIGGDQLLPRITPSIGIMPSEPEGDPLRLFLESLKQFYQIPDNCLVLPSHELPYRGIDHRLDAMYAHHDERCDRVLTACSSGGLPALEVVRAMFDRELDPMQQMMALGEGVAHLHYLIYQNKIKREIHRDGLYRYTTIEEHKVVTALA